MTDRPYADESWAQLADRAVGLADFCKRSSGLPDVQVGLARLCEEICRRFAAFQVQANATEVDLAAARLDRDGYAVVDDATLDALSTRVEIEPIGEARGETPPGEAR